MKTTSATVADNLLHGQVPTLETPQGGVFESNAIARYVARLADKGLFGKTAIDMVRIITNKWLTDCWPSGRETSTETATVCLQAHVEQWIDFATTEVGAPLDSVLYPLLYPGNFTHDKKVSHFQG